MTLRSGSFDPVSFDATFDKSPPGDGASLGQAEPSNIAERAYDDRHPRPQSRLLITSGTAGTVEP
jgi:hypothetical protein